MFQKKPSIEGLDSVPHPELTPLTDDECKPPVFRRDPMLSMYDYSDTEIGQAKDAARAASLPSGKKLPMDMREYCHNNGIDWQVDVRKVGRP